MPHLRDCDVAMPSPPSPQERTGSSSSSLFSRLVNQLVVVHERELHELRIEICHLRRDSGIEELDYQAPFERAEEKLQPIAATSVEVAPVIENTEAVVAEPWKESDGIAAETSPPRPADQEKPSHRYASQRHKSKLLDNEERTRAEDFVHGPLSIIIAVCIVLNTALIFLQLEYSGYQAGVHLQLRDSGVWPPVAHNIFAIIDHCFNLVFIAELVINLCVFRWKYFQTVEGLQWFNMFDALIISVTILESYILTPLKVAEGSNFTFIRMVRFIRIFRTLRIVRTVEAFSSLRVLVTTIAASFLALFWSMVLIVIVMMMGALVLCQLLNTAFHDDTVSDEMKEWAYNLYGTPVSSFYTMFELTFSGCWPTYARPLVENLSPAFAAFFMLYISLVVFAMFRIISALFLKDTLSVATNDADMMIYEKTKERQRYAEKLLEFFKAADVTGEGELTCDQFEFILDDPKFKTYLSILELDPSQAGHLFSLLDCGEGVVSAQEFVQGALRLKGQARSQDVITIMRDCNRLLNKMVQVENVMMQHYRKVDILTQPMQFNRFSFENISESRL